MITSETSCQAFAEAFCFSVFSEAAEAMLECMETEGGFTPPGKRSSPKLDAASCLKVMQTSGEMAVFTDLQGSGEHSEPPLSGAFTRPDRKRL